MSDVFRSSIDAHATLESDIVKGSLAHAALVITEDSPERFFAIFRDRQAGPILSEPSYEDLGLEDDRLQDRDVLVVGCVRRALEVNKSDLGRHTALNLAHRGVISIIAAPVPHFVVDMGLLRSTADGSILQADATFYRDPPFRYSGLDPALNRLFFRGFGIDVRDDIP